MKSGPRGASEHPLMAAERSYRQQLAQSGGQPVQTVLRAPAGSPLAATLYDSPPYRLQVPALSVARLSINLSAARVSGAVEGERSRCFQAGRHSLFLTPALAQAHWCKEAASRHLNLYFDAGGFDGHHLEGPALDGARSLGGRREVPDCR
jgi:hypothetical protein